MTHRESLTVLLAAPRRGDDERRQEAERHVTNCGPCWDVLRTVRALTSEGTPPTDAAFGCDAVEEQLFELVELDATAIRTRQPDVARHLGWCLGCRTLFAQLVLVEADATAGDYGPPITVPTAPAWRAVAEQAGRRARELVDAIAVSVRDGLVAIAAVPVGVEARSLATSGATRSPEEPAGVRLHVRFPDAADGVMVTVSPAPRGRVGLAAHGAFDAATLRVRRGPHDELIGAVPSHDGREVVFRDVPPGPYVLGIVTAQGGELRIPITVAAVD